MKNKRFMCVQEVAEELGISESYAYKIIRQLNKELAQKGMITITGKVSRRYFLERLCYGNDKEAAEEER